MQIFLNLLNAKKIAMEVNPVDTVETFKKKISEVTGLPLDVQSLRVHNGATCTILNGMRLCLGDLLKPGTLINLTYQQEKKKASFYLNAVTVWGKVLTVIPEKGIATSIDKLRKKFASILELPVESLFLRVVDMSRFLNRPLVPFFNTLEEFSVGNGSVIYLQVHPWQESWYHGKISRDQAEQVMGSACEGQFLVKESVNFPGDYVLFVCIGGEVKHYRIFCKRNMMFTLNDREFFNSIEEMVKTYQNSRGRLPIKLTEPVVQSQIPESCEEASLYSWEASSSHCTVPRDRLHTASSPEIQLRVVLGTTQHSLLTSPFSKVSTLKEQIEELTGIPVDCQLLRLDDKPLVMDTFLVCDHHITERSVVYVQVHPWNEDWYVGRMSAVEVESMVRQLDYAADGMFLVRESISYPGDYVLYVWSKGKSRQFRVLNRKNLFTIDNRQQFASLTQLVEYYKRHEGPLGTRLHKPLKCDKEQRGLIPPAVLARGTKARAAYKRALENGKTRDFRVRVMLIGQDRTGKTSLKRSLKGERFNKDEASTDGVEMDLPLLKVGVQAWKTPQGQGDESSTVFDHRSAQLVARQLSGESDDLPEPTVEIRSPGLPEQRCAPMNVLTNGYQSPRNSLKPNSAETIGKKQITEPLSQSCPDEVFITDSQPNDSLPQSIVSLVEGILRKQHSVNEDVWPVIWDFAGQSLYHALHPIFMSREAVYLLVADLSADLFATAMSRVRPPGAAEHEIESSDNNDTNLDHLMRWMDLVHALRDPTNSIHSDVTQPPVILVGTHADKINKDPWKSINTILDSFRGKSFLSHIVEEQFVVDNTRAGQPFQQEDPNVHRLRKKVLSVAAKQPHTQREIPLQWLLVERELQELSRKGVKHITKTNFKLVSQKICNFRVEEDSEQLLNFLSDCGAVLNFCETDDPDGLVILDPQWLIEAFCQIITVAGDKKEPMRIREHRRMLAKEGILSEELIDYACQNLSLTNVKDLLLSIMEKSNLICKWYFQGSGLVYLVPFMLTAKPQEEISSLMDKGAIGPIYLTLNSGYIPYGLFARLLALFAQWVKQKFSPRQPKLYANVARFFIGEKDDFCVTFVCYKAVVRIELLHEGESDMKGEANVICRDIVRCVDESLAALREQCFWLRSLAWQLCARCDLCRGEGDDSDGCLWHHVHSCTHPDCGHFIPLDSNPLRCYRTFKSNTFLNLDKLQPWIMNFHGKSRVPENLSFKPGRVPSQDLLLLAHDLGKQWETLCCHLLDELELQHIDHDEKTLLDKCYGMLIRWSQARGSEATYAVLGQALIHPAMDRADLCKKYCLLSFDETESLGCKHVN